MSDAPRLFTSLRHRDFRILMGAFATSAIGSWAYNVALVVWVFGETRSPAWVGATTICRFVPALLFSAYGGVVAERFEQVRLMIVLDVASTAVMITLALEMTVHAPVALAIATAAVSSTIGMAYEPAVAALTPQLVGERDLGSANTLRNSIDNVCVIAGPGLGAVLLLAGPPSVAVAVNAATFLVSAIALAQVRARSKPVDVTEGGELGPLQQTLVGARAIASSSTAAALVIYSVIATFVFGTDTVLFVVLSRDVLRTGAEGYGYLLVGLGVGGVLAAGPVARLERLPRLGLVILLGLVGYCLPTLLFLVIDQPAVAFVIQVVRGASTLVVDVLAVTALQRSLPRDLLARVFGAFNAFMLLAIIVAAFLTPLAIDSVGLDTTLWIVGLAIPIVSLIGWPVLRRMDRDSAGRRVALAPKLALLNGCDLFASVSEGAIGQLAGAAAEIDARAGQVIVEEGQPADAFYVIADGTFGVRGRGEGGEELPLDELGPGDYFGEIGLIEQIPRTATITAQTAGRLLRVDGNAFVDALTASAPSPALLDGASLRLRRTHPSLRLTRSALEPGQ
jgi:Transmembrane secretion effector/Cyclic nucleotide-binding domain